MTDLIIRPRQGGKTTELIRRTAETGAYIVCGTQRSAFDIMRRAREMGVSIPFPLTAHEFTGGDFYGPGIRGIAIDDLDMLIRSWSRVPVVGATWTAADFRLDPAGGGLHVDAQPG